MCVTDRLLLLNPQPGERERERDGGYEVCGDGYRECACV